MKGLAILLFFLSAIQFVKAQDSQFKEPIPRTPNAASLGKYGDIPVSHYTGVPNISIPIYTVTEGELSLPISLSYHGSGIKVNETASWVGLGWSLNAGGIISRTVVGGRDEGNTYVPMSFTDKAGWGWYKDNGILDIIMDPCICTDGCNVEPITDLFYNCTEGCNHNDLYEYPGFTNYNCRAYFLDAANGFIDTEPDIYTYNFDGNIGKFVFGENRKLYTIPQKDLLIEPINDEQNDNYFKSWKITTPDGTKYYFGGINGTENNYTYAYGSGGVSPEYNTATTWYLYRIESVNGDKFIELDYETEAYSVADRVSHILHLSEYITCSHKQNERIAPGHLMVNMIDGRRLSKIRTSSGNVEIEFQESSTARTDLSGFNAITGYAQNSSAKALSEIHIKDACGSVKKIFVLDTDSYFTSSISSGYPEYPGVTHDTRRLRLNSIQEFNGDKTISKPPYIFTYNSTQMARRFSLARDYWGYYNGADSNQGLVPTMTNPCGDIIDGRANRNVIENKMKAWTLESIEYPTGGKTFFAFEAHEYSENPIGGLRVASITKRYNNNQPDEVVEYEYECPRLHSDFPYISANSMFIDDPSTNPTIDYYHGGTYYKTLNASPKSSVYSTQGYIMSYGRVKEMHVDHSYIQYEYDDKVYIPDLKYPKMGYQSPLCNGVLRNVYQKDASNNTIASEQYNYNYYSVDTITEARRVFRLPCTHLDHDHDPTYVYSDRTGYKDYKLFTMRLRPTSKIASKDGVTTTTTYTYDSSNKHGNPIIIETVDSNQKSIRNEFVYPSDPGSGAPVQMYDVYNTNYKHMPGVLIQETTKVNSNTVSKVLNNYAYDAADDVLQPTSTITYPTGGSDYVSVSYGFDDHENIEIIGKSDGVVESYYWGYNNALPVARIINAEINNIHEIVSTTKSASTHALNNIPNWTNLGAPLVLDHDQTVNITIDISQHEGTNASCIVRLAGPGPSYYIESNYYPGTSNIVSLHLEEGSYQFQYKVNVGTARVVFLDIDTDYAYTNIENNIIYEGFEEDAEASTSFAKTGKKSKYGAYTLNLYADPGTYILSYWKKNSSSAPWVYHETELVNPPDTYSIANSGQYTDEIRFYPKGAQMETYTHDPIAGVTSVTDINNQTTYYEYDDLGRLIKITDSNGNLIQKVDYNYTNL